REGHACWNVGEQDQAVIAHGGIATRDQMRAARGFRTGRSLRRFTAARRRLIGPISFHRTRGLFAVNAVSVGEEVGLETVFERGRFRPDGLRPEVSIAMRAFAGVWADYIGAIVEPDQAIARIKVREFHAHAARPGGPDRHAPKLPAAGRGFPRAGGQGMGSK